MAAVKRRGGRWEVRWEELRTTVDHHGRQSQRWASRRKSCATQAAAKELARQIENAASRGENWQEERRKATATLRALALGYVQAAVDAGAPLGTQRYRSALIGTWMDWLDIREEGTFEEGRTVTELSLTMLQAFAKSLPSGTTAQRRTRHRKVMEIERMWTWGHNRPEGYPGVPAPRRYTGADADQLSAPAPVVAIASPTWADVDAMIAQLALEWHRRACLIIRYTGMRASQVCGITWEDIDLHRNIFHLRAGRTGAKKGRGRVVPIGQPLAAELSQWAHEAHGAGQPSGLLFPRRYKNRTGPYRADVLVPPLRKAWTLAKVPKQRWGIEPGRAHASPTHAIRRCVRTQLIRAGVEEAIVLHLVGHSQGHTAAAYVPESNPEENPFWPHLLAAVAAIPDHRADPAQ